MPITADELRSLLGCQREQVVVVGVGRVNRRRGGRIADQDRGSRQPGHEGVGIRRRDETLELRVRERRRSSARSAGESISSNRPPARRAGAEPGYRRGDQRRDQDVDIEDGAQRATAAADESNAAPRRQGERLIFGEPVRCPDAIEQLQARSRRRASSMTSLSPFPVRAARTLTARSRSASTVSVVRTFAMPAS